MGIPETLRTLADADDEIAHLLFETRVSGVVSHLAWRIFAWRIVRAAGKKNAKAREDKVFFHSAAF